METDTNIASLKSMYDVASVKSIPHIRQCKMLSNTVKREHISMLCLTRKNIVFAIVCMF